MEDEGLIRAKFFRVFIIVFWVAIRFLKSESADKNDPLDFVVPERVFALAFHCSGCYDDSAGLKSTREVPTGTMEAENTPSTI